MNTQEIVRNRLVKMTIEEGITQKHIATKLGIAESSLSKYKNSTYNLTHVELDKLDSFLTSKGY